MIEWEMNQQRIWAQFPKKERKGEQIFLFGMTHPPLVGIMNGSHYWI
jgi:hypothetical protein